MANTVHADPAKQYTIISISKQDIINFLRGKYAKSANLNKIVEKVNKLNEGQMAKLVAMLRDEYIEQMLWFGIENNLREVI